jgi:hypothetical protein
MTDLQALVRTEIEELHVFLVGWFTGDIPASDFEPRFLDHLDPGLLFVPPAGARLARDRLVSAIRQAYGSNPEFRIEIRKVEICHVLDNHVVATYEEWQRNASFSKPSNNGRISTVVLTKVKPLRWLAIHETWLPDAVMRADAYDF